MTVTDSDLSALPDTDLIRKIVAERDEAAFETMAQRHAQALYSVARHIVSDKNLAEDAVQETLLVLWRCPEKYRTGRATVRTWLLSIAAHKALKFRAGRSFQAARARQLQPIPDLEGLKDGLGGEAADRGEVFTALQAQLACLPDLDRQLVALAFGAGLTQKEIAHSLRMPQTTVSHRLQQTLRGLGSELRKAGFAELCAADLLAQAICAAYGPPADLGGMLARCLNTSSAEANAEPAPPGRPGLRQLSPTAIGAIATLALSAAVAAAYVLPPQKTSPARASAETAGTPREGTADPVGAGAGRFKQSWTFDSPGQLRSFEAPFGGLEYQPSQGLNGGGCLLLRTNSVLAIPLPSRPLPLKVTWHFQALGEHFGNYLCWKGAGYSAVICQLGYRQPSIVGAQWRTQSFILTEGTIDRWLEGHGRTGFFFSKAPEAKLVLEIRNNEDPVRIEDLTVEQIEAKDVPPGKPRTASEL